MGRTTKRSGTGTRARARWGLLVVSAMAVVVLAASPASAAGTLDQSYEGMSGSGSIDFSPVVGQTFTAGITGHFDQVDFGLSREAADAAATVEIRTTSGGLPTDTVLATASVPAAAIPSEPALVPIAIGPLSVTAGTTYAIVVTGHGFLFHGDTNGTYAGGAAVVLGSDGEWRFDPGNADLAFRTYATRPPCKLVRVSITPPPLPPIVLCV